MAGVDVVVLGSGLNALGVLRSLGGRGLKLVLVSRNAAVLPAYSRFVHKHVIAGDAIHDPEAILALSGAARGAAALLLTEELDTAACLADVAAWRERFRTCFYTPEVAAKLLEKTRFDALARLHGAPVPVTVVITPGDADPAGLANRLRFPVAVKPVSREPRYDARFRKAYRIADAPGLHALLDELQQVNVPLVVQEWVEGEDSDIYFNLVFLAEDGELGSSFVGRKILCWPPHVGGTASCMAAPEHHHELTEITVGFLRQIGFRGLLGMEYKRDPRDGRFYMIEPTVYRTDYQHEIATLSGVPFLAAVVARLRGLAVVPEGSYSRVRYWVDNPAARYSAEAGRGGSDSTVEPVALAARRVDAWFRISDPLPGAMHYGRLLAAKLRNVLRRRRGPGDMNKKSVRNA